MPEIELSRNYNAGQLAAVELFDDATEEVVVRDGAGGEVERRPADEQTKEQQRAERQLGRVDTALTDLRAQTRLTVSDYRFDTTTVTDVDVRELARRINALEKLNKDLIRLIRGLAAEDEV